MLRRSIDGRMTDLYRRSRTMMKKTSNKKTPFTPTRATKMRQSCETALARGKTTINAVEAADLLDCTAFNIRQLVKADKLPRPVSMDRHSITFDLAHWV